LRITGQSEVNVVSTKTWTVAAAAALVLAAGTARAEDCGCPADRQTHAVSALPGYSSAFAGRVVAVQDTGTGRKVTLQVFRAWKGPRGKALDVTTSAGACGVAFEQGADYVVYATGKKEDLRTDACSLTAPLAQSARAVRQLDLHAGYGSNPLRVPSSATNEARK
jgi:hypothetical protein